MRNIFVSSAAKFQCYCFFFSGNQAISVSLADFDNSTTKGQAFYKRVSLAADGESVIDITDIPSSVSFVIVQVHTHENNITLSYDEDLAYRTSNRSLFGSNIGLEVTVGDNSSTSVYASNNNSVATEALVAVVAYTDKG